MSYCRWSSDDFLSDIYAYANVYGNYTVHVAAKHLAERPPSLEWPQSAKPTDEEWMRFFRSQKAQSDALEHLTYIDLSLPYAGETLTVDTLAALEELLCELRALGYHVPQHAFVGVREEKEEEDDAVIGGVA